ncbi:MAG: 1-acyl-sn-glycerol-3-phosphate acyltransferase [Candidatus Eremiobacteraeota bacterium]|nr:1-acyl-sn-glycerol-3-phosphate acyltransferase [Candidatus Eremiobacteraeota bacterium]
MSDTAYIAARGVLKPLLSLLFAVRSSGAEFVPKDGPLIVASNHVSYLDPPILGCWFPRVIHYMAKEELFRVPVLGALIRSVNTFPVNREQGDRAAIRHALRVLKDGGVVGIFPEGRRNLDGEAQARSGAVLLAATARCPIVPVALVRTHLAARQLRAAKVEVRIGAPLQFQGTERKATKTELATWTDAVTRRIGELMESNADPKSEDPGVLLRR